MLFELFVDGEEMVSILNFHVSSVTGVSPAHDICNGAAIGWTHDRIGGAM